MIRVNQQNLNSGFKALVNRFVDIRDDEELKGLLIATAYGFFIMISYYILRAIRDEISSADRGNLQILWSAVFLVMLLAVPAYSWLATKYSRDIFVPLANRFFIFCLLCFWICLVFMPSEARVWIDRVFYVWTSVFALFIVAVFWGFLSDCFDNNQGKRFFSFIAVGSSLGAATGSSITAVLVAILPAFSLLLLACIPLEMASRCAKHLHHQFSTGSVAIPGEAARVITGTAWSGMRAVFESPYLMGIAVLIALMTFVSTMLYFQQANLVAEVFANRGERTIFYAKVDLVVSLLTVFFQVYLTARIIRWLGVGVTLAIIPLLMVLGFIALGFYPTLAVLVVVQVTYRAGRYGLTKPAREILWTVLGREAKYKSKPFLDAAVYRGGDLLSGWVYTGFTVLGMSIGAIAFTTVPVAGIWTILALKLGSKQDKLAIQEAVTS
jgi:AAA family ATP:ADP antiporter